MILSLRDLAVALLILAVATGAGAGILKLVRIHPTGWLERTVISCALGFALVSYLLFGFGSLGWLDWTMVSFVLGSVGLVSLYTWIGLWRSIGSIEYSGLASEAVQRLRQSWQATLIATLIATSALLNLIGALAPPTEWDSLDYHLSAVKHFVNVGKVEFVPYINWTLPMTAEMWNMLGLLLGSDRMPQVFQWAMGLASAGALYLLAASRTSRRTALLAAAIYYTSTQIVYLSSSAKSDLAWLTFLFLSLHTLLVWNERNEGRWLILSAIFTGLTLSTRLQGLFWAPGIGLVLVVLYWPRLKSAPIRAFGWLASYGAISTPVVSPWYIRNWIAGGDLVR